MGREWAVSQPHGSSDSRDKAVCSGTEKTWITTKLMILSICFLLYLMDFLCSVRNYITV